MSMENFKKTVQFFPAFHKVHEDPSKNYGVGAVRVCMILQGDNGAISFSFSTGMMLKKTYGWWKSKGLHLESNRPDHMGYDVSYHALTAQFEGQTSRDDCPWLNGKPCFCDGSAMRADEWMDVFVEKGDEAIWSMMEADYKERFEHGR